MLDLYFRKVTLVTVVEDRLKKWKVGGRRNLYETNEEC